MSVTNITEHLLLNPRSHCLIITIVLFDLVWCFDLVFQFKIQDYFIISFKKLKCPVLPYYCLLRRCFVNVPWLLVDYWNRVSKKPRAVWVSTFILSGPFARTRLSGSVSTSLNNLGSMSEKQESRHEHDALFPQKHKEVKTK